MIVSEQQLKEVTNRLEVFNTAVGIQPYVALDAIIQGHKLNAADAARVRQNADLAIDQLRAIAVNPRNTAEVRADAKEVLGKIGLTVNELIFGLDKQIVIYAAGGLAALLVIMLATKRRRA